MDQSILVYCIQALSGAFCALLWASFKEVKSSAEKHATEFANYKVVIAEKYSTKSELRDVLSQVTIAFEKYGEKLDTRLERIEGKIDLKMDKP